MVRCSDLIHPVQVPPTSHSRYISFLHALNLQLPEEDTGDWHFRAFYFSTCRDAQPVLCAGEGEEVNSNASLDVLGIRDMADTLRTQQVYDGSVPVYVANHYRAVADITLSHLLRGEAPRLVDSEINAWFNTKEEIDRLRADYLAPLRAQLDTEGRETFDGWIATIKYQT